MKRMTTWERWAVKVDFDGPNGCWLWTASLNNFGYGNFSLHGKPTLAHRAAWEIYVAPIPAGLHIDHLCRVRHCVNPEHLEVVTRAENMRRSPLVGRFERTPETRAAQRRAMTHRQSA